jgi:hypothetical protein
MSGGIADSATSVNQSCPAEKPACDASITSDNRYSAEKITADQPTKNLMLDRRSTTSNRMHGSSTGHPCRPADAHGKSLTRKEAHRGVRSLVNRFGAGVLLLLPGYDRLHFADRCP